MIKSDRSQHNGSDAIFNIKLHKSEKLIDDSFVFIARDENRTSLVHDFDKLAEKYSDCFYRNENSAIDLCDGNMVTYFKAGGNESGRKYMNYIFSEAFCIINHGI